MSQTHQALLTGRLARWAVTVVALVVVAFAVVLGSRSLARSLSAASPVVSERLTHGLHDRPRGDVPGRPQGDPHRALGVADGKTPDGVTIFDDAYPAVANLDPTLLDALRQAATDAAGDGIGLYVNSGWRSPQYQEQLLDEAVAEYGSTAEAARWVATRTTSPHVSGDAVDIGHTDAAAWLSLHGAEHGLCQIYGNEPWHFELRPEAVEHGCPPRYADPTEDPRMRH